MPLYTPDKTEQVSHCPMGCPSTHQTASNIETSVPLRDGTTHHTPLKTMKQVSHCPMGCPSTHQTASNIETSVPLRDGTTHHTPMKQVSNCLMGRPSKHRTKLNKCPIARWDAPLNTGQNWTNVPLPDGMTLYQP